MTETSAKARYDELKIRREPFLRRARECSSLTIPSLIPPEGHNPSMVLPQPEQGLGSRLVVSLASRLMTALLPPGRNCLRLGISPEALLETGADAVPEDLEIAMVKTERLIHMEIERKAWRQPTNMSLQHLIVGGNVVEYLQPDNTIRIFRFDQFVVVRSPSGEEVEFVIADDLDPDALSPSLKALYETSTPPQASAAARRVTLYTWGVRAGDRWTVHQELGETKVPKSSGRYQHSSLPFLFLRWQAVAGEDYGRSKVEEHLPDLKTLDGFQKALRDGVAMASRNITLIRPNAAAGLNLRRKIARANNGEYVIGNPEDVNMLQFANTTGIQVTQTELALLRQELSAAFLMQQSGVRDAERVTATEIRMVAQELEGVLGGTYSMLSQEMLSRRVNRLIYQMQAKGGLPEWPEGTIEPVILTGLEALGREAQMQNVVAALQMLGAVKPEIQEEYVKWPVLLKKGFNGLNLSDAVNTEGEAQAIRAQRAQTQMLTDAVGAAAGPLANAAAGQMAPA